MAFSASNLRAVHVVFVSIVAVAIAVFLVWLNHGSMARNMPLSKSHAESKVIYLFGDAWEWESRSLGGPTAIDCGRVPVRGDPKTATQCALKAFREGKPFRVRYDLQGFDSNVSAGLVYTPAGKLYGLDFDGDPAGKGGTSWARQRADKVPCPQPFQMHINPSGRLNCFTKDTVSPRDIMSPNLEAY